VNSAIGQPVDEVTEWTSVADLKNLRWYYRTRQDQSIHMVDLKQAVDAAHGETRLIKMESEQPVANVSSTFMSGKAAEAAIPNKEQPGRSTP
jgi:choloylglycine hydrolase